MLCRNIRRAYANSTTSKLIFSTLILARNPVITADLGEFENQYYKYQNELWKRLMWTFPKWYYYREGTLSEQNYRELNKNPVFNNPNIEFPRGRPEIRQNRDRRFKQEIKLPKTYKESSEVEEEDESDALKNNLSRKIEPNLRITEADKKGDMTSLERKLSRTLYLVVGEKGDAKSGWSLPTFDVCSGESVKPLHAAAEQGLYQIGGDKINYFNVSKKPCHLNDLQDKKEFFIKSHILSGEFKPQQGTREFKWLTKQELEHHLDRHYYHNIEHLLSDI